MRKFIKSGQKTAFTALLNQKGGCCILPKFCLFFNRLRISQLRLCYVSEKLDFIIELEGLLRERKKNLPEGSYSTKLFSEGRDKILQKVAEETIEFVIDAKNENSERMISEGADLIYHLLVALVDQDLSITDLQTELKSRHK